MLSLLLILRFDIIFAAITLILISRLRYDAACFHAYLPIATPSLLMIRRAMLLMRDIAAYAASFLLCHTLMLRAAMLLFSCQRQRRCYATMRCAIRDIDTLLIAIDFF